MPRANNSINTRRFTILWAVFGLICVGYTALVVFFSATIPQPRSKSSPWSPCAVEDYYDYRRVYPFAVNNESEDTK